MSEKYILYVRTDCPFCVKATSLLREKKEAFSVLDLKSRPKVLRELKDIYEWQTVPMIFEKTDNENACKRCNFRDMCPGSDTEIKDGQTPF